MRLHIFSIFILGLISCQNNSKIVGLNGVWCNQINHCIYFNDEKCIIDNSDINEFEVLSNNEIEVVNKEYLKLYQIEVNNEMLMIRKFNDKQFREYRKPDIRNNKRIKDLFFSQISEFSDFEIHINQERKIFLRINYHVKFESGDYVSEISDDLYYFISELVNRISISIKPKLRKEITSGVPEWALKLIADDLHFIYYNYEQIDENHSNLAFLLSNIPYFLNLNQGTIGDKLNEIKEFRESEFKRNLNENDL